mmetsp:Transcript_52106/g.96476  ORF Transcript_52106/g.96476 Transcript_52106/m.96476 type:complete len:182 (-) Transcript_52106:83-628(-)
MATGPPVFAYLTFHVRTCKLEVFCKALAELLTASKTEKGLLELDIHRELPWQQSLSNEEFELYVMSQEWAGPSHLEAHLNSSHAQKFNNVVMAERMLVTEPSVSLFGPPMSPSDIAAAGAEAAAEAAASLAHTAAQSRVDNQTDAVPRASSASSIAGKPVRRTSSSRSSRLQQSATMALQR